MALQSEQRLTTTTLLHTPWGSSHWYNEGQRTALTNCGLESPQFLDLMQTKSFPPSFKLSVTIYIQAYCSWGLQ